MRVMLFCLLLQPGLLVAQADRWERAVADGFRRTDTLMAAQNYRPASTIQFGALFLDEMESRSMPLEGAVRYAIVGLCDGDCAGLELGIADASGYELAADRTGRTVPLLEVTTRQAGVHILRATMSGCLVAPCRYGVRVYRKSR